MDKDFLLEVLRCVFVADTRTFISFIECELTFSFWFPKTKRNEIHLEILEQIEYVLNKREDAVDASSKIVDLLNQIKKSLKD